jgi:uncharacterized protein DUF3309
MGLGRQGPERDKDMMTMFILPVFILIAVVGSLPIWPHSKKWGFYPISGVSVIILIILFLFWTGRLWQR